MYPPVTPDARRSARRPPTWRGLALAVVVVASLPVVLWTATLPLVGVAVVGWLCGVAVLAARFADRWRRRVGRPSPPVGDPTASAAAERTVARRR
jgi:peptidoglycan/LPS O-acetylase OafA/YrhL